MSGRLVTLASYSDPMKAQFDQQKLEAAGIPARVNGDIATTALAGINIGIASVKLEVAESDLERAREILSAPKPVETGIQTQPDEVEPPEDPYSGESLIRFAFRAAVIGLVFFPGLLHVMSLSYIIVVILRDDTLSPSATRKMYIALAIDGVVLVMAALVVRAILTQSFWW